MDHPNRSPEAVRQQRPSDGDRADVVLDGFLVLDGSLRCIHVDARAAGAFGRAPEELAGLALDDAFRGSEGASLLAACRAARAEGRTASWGPVATRDGRSVRVRVQPSGAGVVVHVTEVPTGVDGTEPGAPRQESRRAARSWEEHHEIAVAAAGVCTWEQDVRTQEIAMSKNALAFFGLPSATPFTRGAWESCLHPDDVQPQRDATACIVASDRNAFRSEYRIRHPVKGERWVQTLGRVVRDPSGTPVRLVGINADITEHRHAEDALRQERDLLRSILNGLPGIFYLVDETGRFVRWNDTFEAVSGYARHEIPSLRPGDFFDETDRPAVRAAVLDVLAGARRSLEADFVTKTGERIPYFFTGVRYVMDGRAHVVGMGVDITARRAAERALRESEARFRHMANHAPVIVWIGEPDGSCSFLSESWEHFTGQPCHEALGMGWLEMIHPGDRAVFLRPRAASGERTPFRLECRLRHRAGAYRWVIDSAAPRHGTNGEFLGYMGSVLDIHERKTMEHDLAALTKRLLRVQDEERKALARELHDDIGQSLTALKLNLQAARHGTTDERLAAGLEDALALTGGLVERARQLSLGLHPSVLEDLGLVAALRWYADATAQRSGLRIDVRDRLGVRRVPAGLEAACYRIAQEALTNVVRHARALHVTVELVRRAGEVVLTVDDDGVGFDAQALGGRDARGPSLGVIGMRERASLQGGCVDVTSATGCGTRVTARFPFREDACG